MVNLDSIKISKCVFFKWKMWLFAVNLTIHKSKFIINSLIGENVIGLDLNFVDVLLLF